jgi:hypothetical protein
MDFSFRARSHSLPWRGWFAAAALVAAAVSSGGCCKLIPWALAVDPSLTGQSDANGVLEPGETVVVAPTWSKHNTGRCKWVSGIRGGHLVCTGVASPEEFSCSKAVTESGEASGLTGPGTSTYTIGDSAATYGTIATTRCSDCYSVFVSASTPRPAAHWDAALSESLTGTYSRAKTWTVHVGHSFRDVPTSNPFYAKVETLFHNGVSAGCAETLFCPEAPVSRSDMALFVARGLAKGDANVPVSGTLNATAYNCIAGGASAFTDVASTDPFCRHVHYIAAKNVTLGCAPSKYCPGDLLSRLQMAALVAKAMVAPGGGAAVPETIGTLYSCDPANPHIHFTDVPATDPFCKHVHYLWASAVIAGCGPDTFCRGQGIARDQMAKFLVNAFHLNLYGP